MSVFFFFKQKTAYEMRISDWSSDVCSSDLFHPLQASLRNERAPSIPGLRQRQPDPRDRCRYRLPALGAPGGRNRVHLAIPGSGPGRLDRLRLPARVRERFPEARPDRKSTRLNSSTNAHLVCRLLLEKKKKDK